MADEKKPKLKIARNNMPFYLPVNHTLIWALVLKVFDVPEWAWGLIILWVALLWIAFIHDVLTTEEKDVVSALDKLLGDHKGEKTQGPKP